MLPTSDVRHVAEETQDSAAYDAQDDCAEGDTDTFTLADIQQISPEVAAEVDRIRANCGINNVDAVRRLSLLLPDHLAAVGAVKVVCSEGTTLTREEKTAVRSTLSRAFRQRVDTHWGEGVVDFEGWDDRGFRFFQLLGFISTETPLLVFSPLANGAFYELRGRKQRKTGLQLAHLRRIREHMKSDCIVRIRHISDLSIEDRALYDFDKYGLMHPVAAEKLALQKSLFGRVELRTSPLGGRLKGSEINWCILGLIRNSNVLAMRAVTTQKKLEKMQRFRVEANHDWELIAMPYLDGGWWYVAYRSFQEPWEKWVILSLSGDAPHPRWPGAEVCAATKMRHSQETTAFLAVACMKDILGDCKRLMGMVEKEDEPGWDVEATRELVIARFAQDKKKSNKKNGKAKEQNERGAVSDTGGSRVGKGVPELPGDRGPSSVDRPSPKQKEPEPNSHPAEANASADSAGVAPTTSKRRESNLRLVSSYVVDTQSIDTLRDGRCANDNIVSLGLNKAGKEYPETDIFFFNSFLMNNLEQRNSCYGWAKGFDMHRRIVLPLHDEGTKHWRLVLFWRDSDTPSSKPCDYKMVILDPLQPYALDGHVCRLLERYFYKKLGIRLKAVQPPTGLPQQCDDFNCAIYVWQYAKCYLQDPDTFESAAEQRKSLGWEVDARDARALLRKAAMEELGTEKRSEIVDFLNSDDEFFLSVAKLYETYRSVRPFSPGEGEFQPDTSGGISNTDCPSSLAGDDDIQTTADPGSPALSPVGRKRGPPAPLTPPRPYKRHATSQDTASPTPPGLADNTQNLSEAGHCGPLQAQQVGSELTKKAALCESIPQLSSTVHTGVWMAVAEDIETSPQLSDSQTDKEDLFAIRRFHFCSPGTKHGANETGPGLESHYSPPATSDLQSPPLSDEPPVIVPGHLGQLFNSDFPTIKPQPDADPSTLSLEVESQSNLLAEDLEIHQPAWQDVVATTWTNPAPGSVRLTEDNHTGAFRAPVAGGTPIYTIEPQHCASLGGQDRETCPRRTGQGTDLTTPQPTDTGRSIDETGGEVSPYGEVPVEMARAAPARGDGGLFTTRNNQLRSPTLTFIDIVVNPVSAAFTNRETPDNYPNGHTGVVETVLDKTEFFYYKELSLAVSPSALQHCGNLCLPQPYQKIEVHNGFTRMVEDMKNKRRRIYVDYRYPGSTFNGALSKSMLLDSFFGHLLHPRALTWDCLQKWNLSWSRAIGNSHTFRATTVHTFISLFGTDQVLVSCPVDAGDALGMLRCWEFGWDTAIPPPSL